MAEEQGRIPTRIKSMLVLGLRQFWDPYYQGAAAQITYFILLSFVPAVIIVSQLLSLVNISANDIDYIIDKMADPSVGRLLKRLLSTRLGTSNNVVLAATALWASSKMQFAMQKVANYMYTNGRTTGSFIKERLRSIMSMSLTVFIFAFIAVILVNGPVIIELLFGNILEGTTIDLIWTYARWPLTGLLYFLLVMYNYWTLPNSKLRIKKLTIRDVFPGSVFAAIGMLLVTYFYALYVSNSNMGAIYGALSTVVALMMWFFLLSNVMIFGMMFNKVWTDSRDDSYRDA